MLPIFLEMTNFQCYSTAKVEFDFSSALIIGERDNNIEVSNGAGKSAVFEAISWALWGRSRHKMADQVVRRGTDFCEVDFVFEHNGKKYRIIRKRNARFSKVEVMFFEFLANGQEKAFQGDTNREIDEKIREVTKSNYDVFLNSCYFMQNTISDFLNGTPAAKQKIISSILNLDRWDEYMKKAKSSLDDYKTEFGKIEFALNGKENVLTDLAKARIDLKEKKNKAQILAGDEARLSNEISELEKRATDLRLHEVQLNDYHDNVSRLENAIDRQKELESIVREKADEIDVLSNKISANSRTMSELDTKIDEVSSQVEIGSHVDLDKFEKLLVNKKTNLGWYIKRVRDWDGAGICLCCERRWDEHEDKVAEFKVNESKKTALSVEVSQLEEKVAAAKEVLLKVKQSEVEIEKYTGRYKGLEKNNEIYALKKEVAENELSQATKSLEEIRQRVKLLQDKIEGMKEIANSSSFEEVRILLKSKKDKRSNIANDRNELSYEVGGLTQKVQELENASVEKSRLEEEMKATILNISVYESLYKSFGRNGIQAIIIDNVIEELTRVANEWLNEFCYEPTYIKFVTQKKDTKGGWKETLEVEVVTSSGDCDFESLSGGEAFRVAFAIRLALAQIQARRMGGETQVLLLDEVSTSLDRHGLDMFVQIIRKLEKHMKVMVVTHDDKLKDEFAHIIYVRKSGDVSTIEAK